MSDKLTALLEIMSLDNKDAISSHINAEPKVLVPLFEKLSTDVSINIV